jgi:hypothetical protein
LDNSKYYELDNDKQIQRVNQPSKKNGIQARANDEIYSKVKKASKIVKNNTKQKSKRVRKNEDSDEDGF